MMHRDASPWNTHKDWRAQLRHLSRALPPGGDAHGRSISPAHPGAGCSGLQPPPAVAAHLKMVAMVAARGQQEAKKPLSDYQPVQHSFREKQQHRLRIDPKGQNLPSWSQSGAGFSSSSSSNAIPSVTNATMMCFDICDTSLPTQEKYDLYVRSMLQPSLGHGACQQPQVSCRGRRAPVHQRWREPSHNVTEPHT